MEYLCKKEIMRNIFTLALLTIFTLSAFGQTEICFNRIDDDGDGDIDCLDQDCYSSENCWECLTEFYQVHSNSQLVALEPATGIYTTLGTISGAEQINGLQFNHLDGHVYAPCIINGQHTLGMLNRDGSVIDLNLNLPGSSIFYVGGIDAYGKLYLSNPGQGINYIDLTQSVLSVQSTGVAHPGVADFSLDNTNGLFYGINGAADLVVYDPIGGNVNTFPLAGSINNDAGGYGAAWSCVDGSFFAYNNSSGKIYTINVNDFTATEVLNATGNLSINDGFNCLLAPPPFESNCGNGIDDDGDGFADCEDNDCFNSNQCLIEICNNGIDDDGDGWVDCSDTECFSVSYCIEDCTNGIDDNGNGLVDEDDPQCGTGSGNTGGLESNGALAQKLTSRHLKRKMFPSQEQINKIEGIIPFEKDLSRSAGHISQFIPSQWNDCFVAQSTPEDLIGITNATEIASADYYQENIRIATVLGLSSENGVYEHSKYICDRLEGARLMDLSLLFVDGMYFTSYELQNRYGQVEYAVSFSVRNNQQNNFTLESHWNLYKYQEDADFLNFQIWTSNYEQLIELLTLTLSEINEYKTISDNNYSNLPPVFVVNGEYTNGKLNLTIRNKIKTTQIALQAGIRRTENGTLEELDQDLVLTGSPLESISIDLGSIYDIGLSLGTSNYTKDNLYMADGSWVVEPSALTQIENVNYVEQSLINTQDDYHIERSIEIEANTEDYFNIFRSLSAKLLPKDLNEFDLLQFTATGNVQLEVRILKGEITSWEAQPVQSLQLTGENQEYMLTLEHFSSSLGSFDLSDVHSLAFSVVNNGAANADVHIELGNLRFAKQTSSIQEQNTLEIDLNIFPNPTQDQIHLSWNQEEVTAKHIRIIDALGQTILFEDVKHTNGAWQKSLANIPNGSYTIELIDAQAKQYTNRFVKI